MLVSLLRPGGVMHIGLYSALARADIRAARAFIAERGYGETAADIRRCRQELLALRGRHAAQERHRAIGDFFTTGECRDLLFHVQEHQFTIPRDQGVPARATDSPSSVSPGRSRRPIAAAFRTTAP